MHSHQRRECSSVCIGGARTGKVVGSTSYTRTSPLFFDSPVASYELGGSTKGRAPKAPMLQLFAGQVGWAFEHLGASADFITMHTRIATQQTSQAYAGNVFGLALKVAVPMFGDFSHYVGPHIAEPFVTSVMQLDQKSWDAAIPQSPIYAPNERAARFITQLFIESVHTNARPDVKVAESAPGHVTLPALYQLNSPDPKHEALCLLSNHSTSSYEMADIANAESDRRASPGLSDRVIVENDVASNRTLAPEAFRWLDCKGFRLSGIAPSHLEFGRLALMFGRRGSIPAKDSIATADLSALDRARVTQQFFTKVLQEQRPIKQNRGQKNI